jgi:hypothetical protein
MKAKLTNAQVDMLYHRLSGPDDLVEVVFGFDCLGILPHYDITMRGDSITDEDIQTIQGSARHMHNWVPYIPWAEVDGEKAHDILTEQVNNGLLDTDEWNEACPELLAELLEGSTYVCCVMDEPLEYARACRTMTVLEKKLEPLVGRVIDGAYS